MFTFSNIYCIVYLVAFIELLQELWGKWLFKTFLQSRALLFGLFFPACAVEIGTEHPVSWVLLIAKQNHPIKH